MTAPSFAGVSYEEAVKAREDLIPELRERAARAEDARIILPETLADLHRTGRAARAPAQALGRHGTAVRDLFRCCLRTGPGLRLDFVGGGDLLIHHWMLGLWDEAAQRDVWGSDPEALIASGVATAQGKAWAVDGGYRVTGRWNFSSGVNVATWNMLGITVQDGDEAGMQGLIRDSQVRLHDRR